MVAPRILGSVTLLATCLASLPRAASASDGAYGRLDGDLSMSATLGVSQAFPGETLHVGAGALYLSSVGLYAQYDESFGRGSPPLERAAAGGVQVRPLFLGRFARDLEQGPAHLDLWVDSLALGLGLFHARHTGQACPGATESCGRTGVEVALGLELPLLPRISGPFLALRGALRVAADPEPDAGAVSGLLSLAIGYRHMFLVHLVDAGDGLAD